MDRQPSVSVGTRRPAAQRKSLPLVVDASALCYPTVFCSAGQRSLELELAPDDLVLATGATVAPIARP
jgi:Cys-tRNA(Pro)/Cys-tRNA(Cys) deacylase